MYHTDTDTDDAEYEAASRRTALIVLLLALVPVVAGIAFFVIAQSDPPPRNPYVGSLPTYERPAVRPDAPSNFLNLVRQEAPSFAGVPDDDLILQARTVCDADRAGTSEEVMTNVYVRAGLTGGEAGSLIYAARVAYC